jgi:hypothetical protein
MAVRFEPYDPASVALWRGGGADDNGRAPERAVSDGGGSPCRFCLRDIRAGAPMLVLAARPFEGLHPYAETGPIFLHAEDCAPWCGEGAPPILATSPDYLVRGYGPDERIVYGTGRIVPADEVVPRCTELLAHERIAFVDVRSARNNCFQARARPSAGRTGAGPARRGSLRP